MEERLKNLDHAFHPRSIAMVGATEAFQKWGFIIFNNIIRGGFEGGLHPVNPGRDQVAGYKAYPSVRAVPGDVDLAVFTVPARQVVASMDDCVAKGVKAGVVITAGFKEMGGEFADLEAELVAKARAGDMVIVGPNGQGICCPESRLYPWMANFYPPAGSISVVSQSGNVQNILIDGSYKSGFGVSKAVSSGNEADLRTEDFFEYLAEDPATEVILSYMEGVSDGRRFFEKARAAAAKKPVIVFKGGSTEPGRAAARTHTAAMAVSDLVFDAACRQAGVIRVRDVDDAGVIASSFLNRPLPRGRRVGIITGGGGLGVIASDICTGLGLEVPSLSRGLLEKIARMMPDWWVPGNPVDMVAGLNFGFISPLIETIMRSGEVDSIMMLFISPPRNREKDAPQKQGVDFSKVWKAVSQEYTDMAAHISSLTFELGIPIYVVSNFGAENEFDMATVFSEKPMTIYLSIQTACRAIAAMNSYSGFRSMHGRK